MRKPIRGRTSKPSFPPDAERTFGSGARREGINYNMPVPTTIQLWDGKPDILQKYTQAGWAGGNTATKYQKTIRLNRVKAELGFSAADYFSLVYELIAARGDVNMDDLTGTELEQAETTLFRRSIAEGIRATMWVGDTTAATGYNTFDGFLKSIKSLAADDLGTPTATLRSRWPIRPGRWRSSSSSCGRMPTRDCRTSRAKATSRSSSPRTFTTSTRSTLDGRGTESAYVDAINGRKELAYHGIPVVDVRLGQLPPARGGARQVVRRADGPPQPRAGGQYLRFPGNEVRMWYNPDQMENRQRAVFMAGCDVLDELLVTYACKS